MWLFTVPSLMPSSAAVSRDRQPEPVPQHDDLALHARGAPGGRRRARTAPRPAWLVRAARSGSCRLGRSRRHGRRRLVDVGADDDLADVGLLAAVAPDPRPRDVELGQRDLQQVLGAVPVAAQRVRHPAQVGLPGGDELRERRVAVGAPSSQALARRRTARGPSRGTRRASRHRPGPRHGDVLEARRRLARPGRTSSVDAGHLQPGDAVRSAGPWRSPAPRSSVADLPSRRRTATPTRCRRPGRGEPLAGVSTMPSSAGGGRSSTSGSAGG